MNLAAAEKTHLHPHPRAGLWSAIELRERSEPLSRARRPPLRFQFFGLPPARARSLLSKAQQPGSFVLDLKIFSCSPIEGAKGAVNVEAVMESSLRMARNEIRHRARLVKVYGNMPEVE
jgi:hypothetical protein